MYRADEKFEMVNLERKEVTYSYFAEPSYVFMDTEFNQFEVDKENMGDALNYLEDGMPCEIVLYNGSRSRWRFRRSSCGRLFTRSRPCAATLQARC